MKILIFGGEGQLGYELVQQSQAFGHTVKAPLETQANIVNIDEVKRNVDTYRPSLVINSAAYTAVDKAETEKKVAFDVNKTGAANLARCCAQAHIPLIQISTDYVFDGQKGAPYLETDPISPLGVYGRSKAEGEIEIRTILKEHIILRTSWLYGIHGQNFVKTMIRLATDQKEVRVVADQYGSPTNATDLARTILTLCDHLHSKPKNNWETYHYCGEGVISWHTFAKKIMELTRLHGDAPTATIEPVTTADYPTRAARPVFSALDCSLIRKHFGISPQPWQKSLEKTIRKLVAAPG